LILVRKAGWIPALYVEGEFGFHNGELTKEEEPAPDHTPVNLPLDNDDVRLETYEVNLGFMRINGGCDSTSIISRCRPTTTTRLPLI
jgi:hypothetical protein